MVLDCIIIIIIVVVIIVVAIVITNDIDIKTNADQSPG